jgi:hypothetical protein
VQRSAGRSVCPGRVARHIRRSVSARGEQRGDPHDPLGLSPTVRLLLLSPARQVATGAGVAEMISPSVSRSCSERTLDRQLWVDGGSSQIRSPCPGSAGHDGPPGSLRPPTPTLGHMRMLVTVRFGRPGVWFALPYDPQSDRHSEAGTTKQAPPWARATRRPVGGPEAAYARRGLRVRTVGRQLHPSAGWRTG